MRRPMEDIKVSSEHVSHKVYIHGKVDFIYALYNDQLGWVQNLGDGHWQQVFPIAWEDDCTPTQSDWTVCGILVNDIIKFKAYIDQRNPNKLSYYDWICLNTDTIN